MRISRIAAISAAWIIVLTVPGWSGDRRVVQLFTDMQKEIVEISDGVKKSVVHIEVVQKSESGRRFRSLGSGVIVDAEGYIITNEHVVGRSVAVKVLLEDKREMSAEVVGVDKQTDLALLKVDVAEDLPAATFANSDEVEVGEWVIAVGNPFGFDRTVSFGIVSGKGRVISDLPAETPLLNNFIQTDAAIDPGSSGGPLVNLRGEIIGINSMGIGRGQGFTIPANMAKEVVERLRRAGSVERGWLGITVQPFDRRFARYYGDSSIAGVLIGDVEKGSPAEAAGLAPGDVITKFGDEDLQAEYSDDLNTFILLVSSHDAGDQVELTVHRDGAMSQKSITIGQQPKVKADEYETPYGFRVKEITFNLARALRLSSQEGVFVDFVEVGGVASEAELSQGDVIRSIEGRSVNTLEDFKVVVESFEDHDMLLLQVQRGNVDRLVLFELKDEAEEGDGS
jgi:Do/DeqQ family serine protease